MVFLFLLLDDKKKIMNVSRGVAFVVRSFTNDLT